MKYRILLTQLGRKLSDFLQRKWKSITGVGASLIAIAALAVGWVASSQFMTIQTQHISYDQTVSAVNGNDYTITGTAYDIAGVVGGIRNDGSFISTFNAPTQLNDVSLTSVRRINIINGQPPKKGDKISLQGNVWVSNPKEALGLDYTTVQYGAPLGKTNAWFVQGTTANVWTIGVHGIGADKNEMLRFIRPVHSTGSSMLIINYRNDINSPQAADKRNHLGDTEWQDVQAAVGYAMSHGATKINLYGDSLGGSLVENYLRRGNNTKLVDRVVLDSPALNWQTIISDRIQEKGLPRMVYYPTALMLQLRANIDVDAISTKPTDIKQKTLIIHSTDDPTVSQLPSKALAKARSDLVTLVDFGQGGHLRSWNNDQARYESTISSFLAIQPEPYCALARPSVQFVSYALLCLQNAGQ